MFLIQYFACDKTEENEMGGAYSACGEGRDVYTVLVDKSEGKRPLGRHRRRWGNNKMYLQEVGCGGMDWIDLVRDRDRW